MLTAFIIFFTSKINLTTIFLHNQAYGITPNLSDFMAFRVAFVYYEFLSWQCLLDGNLQLFVEVVSCRSCRWVFFFFWKWEIMFSEGWCGIACKTYSTIVHWIILLRYALFSFCFLLFLSHHSQLSSEPLCVLASGRVCDRPISFSSLTLQNPKPINENRVWAQRLFPRLGKGDLVKIPGFLNWQSSRES